MKLLINLVMCSINQHNEPNDGLGKNMEKQKEEYRSTFKDNLGKF